MQKKFRLRHSGRMDTLWRTIKRQRQTLRLKMRQQLQQQKPITRVHGMSIRR